jgi:hypothetical protein
MPKDEKDIQPGARINFEWSPGQINDSLQALQEIIRSDAEGVIGWYLRSKRAKRFWARLLRVSTIIAGAAAGITPIVSQIYTIDGKPCFPPAWASVWLALSATLALLDRYFGLSSGWMRYIAAELEVSQLTSEFQLNWETVKAKLGGREPNPQQLALILAGF